MIYATNTWYDSIALYIPVLAWLPKYKWKSWFFVSRVLTLSSNITTIWHQSFPSVLILPNPTTPLAPPVPPQNDLFAGIAVALMVIPQGMSYAQNLAFLPQVYGIYGAVVPTLIYSLLGSSRHLAVGPVAVTSLLLGNGLTEIFGGFSINPSNPYDAYQVALQTNYNHAAIQVSFIAGALYTGIGLLKLGWLVNYLSHPVISGFMTGAASIILATQVKYVTGQYVLPRSDTLYHALKLVFDNMNLVRLPELGMGFSLIVILIFCQILGARYARLRWLRFLGPILVTILSLVIENAGKYYVVDFNNSKTPIIKASSFACTRFGDAL